MRNGAKAKPSFGPAIEFEPDDSSCFHHNDPALLLNPHADAMALVDAARCRARRIEKVLLPFVSLPLDAAEKFDGRDLVGLLLTLHGMNQEAVMLLDAALHLMNEQRGTA